MEINEDLRALPVEAQHELMLTLRLRRSGCRREHDRPQGGRRSFGAGPLPMKPCSAACRLLCGVKLGWRYSEEGPHPLLLQH